MSNDMRIRLRHLKLEDFQNLRDAMVQAYPDMAGAIWREEHIRSLIALFGWSVLRHGERQGGGVGAVDHRGL